MRQTKRNEKVTSDDARDLYEAIQEVVRHSLFREPERVCGFGITLTECHALEVVATRGPLSVNHIATSLNLNKSTASRAIQSLADKGLVRRDEDSHDARAWSVRATPAGQKTYRALIRKTLACYESILADYPEELRRAAIEILRRWSAAVDSSSS